RMARKLLAKMKFEQEMRELDDLRLHDALPDMTKLDMFERNIQDYTASLNRESSPQTAVPLANPTSPVASDNATQRPNVEPTKDPHANIQEISTTCSVHNASSEQPAGMASALIQESQKKEIDIADATQKLRQKWSRE
ncbi:hypothetical protein HDU93_006576, partial [Gonapodya sp. JEL0774]